MVTNSNYPVIVGVGQFTNHPKTLDDTVEPLDMMERVAREAEKDAGAGGVLAKVDSVQVVNIMSWSYADAPGALGERVGAEPRHTVYPPVGGETPQRFVNETAQAIVEGRINIALLAGAEALESRRLARKLGAQLSWSDRATPQQLDGDNRPGFNEVEARHGATMPTRVYPLFENAIRAHLGLSVDDHQRRLGELCSRFAGVAAENPYAWFPQARTPEEIATVRPDNRMVGFPYPKLMNAIIETDQAAAVIMTSTQTARELGIPEDRCVHLHGCGDAVDKWFVSERVNYHASPAIRSATHRALGMAGIDADDVAMFDLYSCFPSAVQLGLDALGLSPDDARPLTVTGGLPYAGGPGNNYVMHSIASSVQRLREAPGEYGLVTGLGWFATKHSAGVYGARPPEGAWRRMGPAVDQREVDGMESPPFVEQAEGNATVETYTVIFNREGEPEQGIVIGRLENGAGARFFANTPPDRELMLAMTREEFVGARGTVRSDDGRNMFEGD
ncbi:MAG TPA: acetyl-CoA acetyltransferase [Dehalococcoidia bacterium]|jgi:acetyl-CoA C-acetyltransferase|nr:acetyl-CoA acetyltransferase [Dehalococcoidia bacterium]